jgi:hypothetical protein
MSDRTVSVHGIWRMGVAVVVGGLLLASTAHARQAQGFVTTGLWVANSGGPTVPEFTAGQTSRGSVSGPKPTLINMSGSFFSPQDTVFDSLNNLWVVDGGDGTGDSTEGVFMFTNAQLRSLATTDTPTPTFAITNSGSVPGFVFPQFGVFDVLGNLYVADPGVNVIFIFTAAQLTSGSGTGLVPAAVFQVSGSTGILGLAFNKGNLYLADNGDAQIFVLNSAHIPTSGGTAASPTLVSADVTLSSNHNGTFASIDGPWGLVFDTAGDLWFSNEGIILNSGPSVVKFAASSLTASGTPTPAAQFTPLTTRAGVTIADPQGVSMDNLGNLAVSNDANNSIAIFKARQLIGSGAVNPGTFLIGAATTLKAPTGLIYGPNLRATTKP